MALPKLNDVPYYDITIPSTNQNTRFRPFLVKEQKILLMAYESKEISQILNAVLDTISSCVENIDSRKLATFDVDYVFTQIRSKAVGEKTDVNVICQSCKTENPLSIDLSQIKVDVPNVDSKIVLSDEYILKMKFPTYEEMQRSEKLFDEKTTKTEKAFITLRYCLEYLQTADKNIAIANESVEDIDDFINSLNDEQYGKISNFVEQIPTVRHEENYKCKGCEKDNKLVLEGLQDFFT